MNWLTDKRMVILGGTGSAIFFAGFSICKLAGSEPHVSWGEGTFNALLCGIVVILALFCTKLNNALIRRMFYDGK